MEYGSLSAWVKAHNLIVNRCKVINDVCLDRCEIMGRGTRYRMVFEGRTIAEWTAYDLESVRCALSAANAVFDVLWDCRRLGLASFA